MRLLTVKKAALEVGVPENFLRTLIKEGKCPGIQQGNRFYVNVKMLIETLQEMSVQR